MIRHFRDRAAPNLPRWMNGVENAFEALRAPQYRTVFRIGGLVILGAGAVLSVNALDLRLSELSLGYLLLNFLVLSPLILLVAGVTLQLSARALGLHLSLPAAVGTAAAANVAEMLPLPGGAMVRAAALMQVGAGVRDSATIITLTALLTLSMAVALSAFALAMLGHPVGWWLAAGSCVGAAAVTAWLYRSVPLGLLTAIVAIRFVTLGVSMCRLAVSFATIGIAAGMAQAALFTVATSLGSAVAIVPAGLGVNEAIAAALATLVATSSAAAFLAVGLNRAVDLTAGAIISALFSLRKNAAG